MAVAKKSSLLTGKNLEQAHKDGGRGVGLFGGVEIGPVPLAT